MKRAAVPSILVPVVLLTVAVIAEAQQAGRMKKIGVLQQYAESDPEGQRRLAAMMRGLGDLGWQEGRNFSLEIRYAAGQFDRVPGQVAELLQAHVDLIVSAGTEPTLAARRATQTVPIVMATIGDPVGVGLIASLSRPGGNITGLSNQATDLSGKWLQLMNEIRPGLRRLGVLWNPNNPSVLLKVNEIRAAVREIGATVDSLPAQQPNEIDDGFRHAVKAHDQAVIVAGDVFLMTNRARVVGLATKYRLPTVTEFRQLAEAGGLMNYGPDQFEMWRRAATYVDKILKGAKPADLPVEQPMKFELIINLKAAKQIGLTIPPNVLARADKVIK